LISLLAHLFRPFSAVIAPVGVYAVVNGEPPKEEGFEGTNGGVLVVMVLVVVSGTSLDVDGRGGKGGGNLDELDELDVEIGCGGTGGAGAFSISNKRQNFTLSGWYLSSQRKA
jgi:hypothetical protein